MLHLRLQTFDKCSRSLRRRGEQSTDKVNKIFALALLRDANRNVRLFCYIISPCVTLYVGRAIAQAVSRRRPTAAARVRAKVSSCGICGVQSGTGVGFLRVLRFPLPVLIPLTAPYSSSIIRGWYNRPVSGRSTNWTQSHPTPKKLKKKTNVVCNVTWNLVTRRTEQLERRIMTKFRKEYILEMPPTLFSCRSFNAAFNSKFM
jgi:hypothetical protein